MNIKLIASDSLGIRSMATVVETDDVCIFIDASASLGPSRYGLPPHPLELEALEKALVSIENMADDCNFFVITHYHYDHYAPDEQFYEKKRVFAKCIDRNINKSQMERGTLFAERFGNKSEIVYCDETDYEIGNTKLKFSPPFPHGPKGTRLGYVIMVTVEEDKKILFASDVQGPVDEKAAEYIIQQNPDILITDGPPSYLLGWKFSRENLKKAEGNLTEIMKKTDCHLILDHHLLRDLKYKEKLPILYGMYGDRIQTFAEYAGKKNNMLEAKRKELWNRGH
ncbi:MAG: MBL fold metallo-hydrolase [Candidatus Thermoplasmatota archaeon]|nr:MBL fold metallo-hydrolase [Candidatus Thermoplasmatota archaeon]